MVNPRVHITKSPADLEKFVADAVHNVVVFDNNPFPVVIGVSGGSIVPVVAKALEPYAGRNIRIFAVDERLVALEDADSNTGAYLKLLPPAFKDKFALLPVDVTNASVAATSYESILRSWKVPQTEGGLPAFDLLFLGMGPDGHTCSLFPGHELVKYSGPAWVLSIEDSPKPPPRRITVSLPVLLAAKRNVLIATGAGKAEVLHKIIDEKDQGYPTSKLFSALNTDWVLDEASAANVANE
uniref:6-phosphogluconolactonase n=1 Tax=Panagrellus redivivus TaxID=6233 RepID=A0A7E4USJ0_PANRE